MPTLHVSADLFAPLAEFTIAGDALGFGEWTLEMRAPARAGRWRALYLDEDTTDDLYEQGEIDEDADAQLLLVHARQELPTTRDLRGMREFGRVAIEAAGFTAADASRGAALGGTDGFYQHLDGVHGAIDGEWGVHVKLFGDGEATIWVQDTAPTGLVLIEF
jgi:hypothetical protein